VGNILTHASELKARAMACFPLKDTPTLQAGCWEGLTALLSSLAFPTAELPFYKQVRVKVSILGLPQLVLSLHCESRMG
jgi:hypothetical protein